MSDSLNRAVDSLDAQRNPNPTRLGLLPRRSSSRIVCSSCWRIAASLNDYGDVVYGVQRRSADRCPECDGRLVAVET